MKEKHLYYLGSAFLVLLVIYFVTKPRLSTVNYDDIVQSVIIGVSKDDVKEIEVYKQTGGDKEARMMFVKRDEQWYMPTKYNAKVKDYSINRILDDMLEMTGKVRSSDPKHQQMFKITDQLGIHVILKDNTQKPLTNVIIGKKGSEVEALKKDLSKLTDEEIFINIQEVRKPEVDAQLVAENVALQLERRVAFRRAMKKAVSMALKFGAQGVKITCSGRLGGAEMSRTEWYREGRVPLHTLRGDIDYGYAEAKTTYGIIGVKVLVFKGEVLSKESAAKVG